MKKMDGIRLLSSDNLWRMILTSSAAIYVFPHFIAFLLPLTIVILFKIQEITQKIHYKLQFYFKETNYMMLPYYVIAHRCTNTDAENSVFYLRGKVFYGGFSNLLHSNYYKLTGNLPCYEIKDTGLDLQGHISFS